MTGRSTLLMLFILALLLLVLESSAAAQTGQTVIATSKIDLAGCLKQTGDKQNYVFTDMTSLVVALRNDKYAAACTKTIERIDFETHMVIGVRIRNPECNSFPLEHRLLWDAAANRYLFQVTHPPVKTPCRGLYEHELWILMPRAPAGYQVNFEINEKETLDETLYRCRPTSGL